MNKHYVYLIKSDKRLIITTNEIIDSDYKHLMDSSNSNAVNVNDTCKIFCIGYIMGNSNDNVINKLEEFK